MRTVILLLLCAALRAQPGPPLNDVLFEGRPAYELANGRLRIVILAQGGAFASITLAADPEKLNPLWNPARMARELGQTGGGPGSGHFVCVDGFGPVSKEERAAGLPGHGEAHLQPLEVKSSGRQGAVSSVTFTARLPVVHEIFTRTIQLVDGEEVVYVESELENLLGFDRPVCWAEHATIGSPFLEPAATVVDMSAGPSKTRPYPPPRPGAPAHRLKSGEDFTWPMAPGLDGRPIDLRAAPLNPSSMDHTTTLVDPARRLAWVTALHPAKRLLLGYVFRRDEFPWLQTWEHYPPTLKMARGLEFSTQPFDVPRREAVETNRMFGAPAYRWLPARSGITSRFLMFYTRTPEGMTGVDDVRLEQGRLRIEQRQSGSRIDLAAALPL